MRGPDDPLGEYTAFMAEALALARAAGARGNVPVGAVVLAPAANSSGALEVVGRGMNLRHVLCDPTAHAELAALSRAGQRLGRWRMSDATLVVTLEPCAMCAAAIRQARIGRLVFGATEPKTGAIVSTATGLRGSGVVVEHGVMAEACAATMQSFFERLRGRRGP